MQISAEQINAIKQLEALAHQDVGRHMERAFERTEGQLMAAALSIAETEKPNVAIVTGFFIERAGTAETDGPLGAALLNFALNEVGVRCRIITDTACEDVCRAALRGVGVKVPLLDVIPSMEAFDQYMTLLPMEPVTHVISTERPGLNHDGVPCNMRGQVITNCLAFDGLFREGPWRRIGIGDGGNEIGMGSLPFSLVSKDIEHGPKIACTTDCDHLIAAGVSNWGMNALIGSLAILRSEWKDAMLKALSRNTETQTLRSMVAAGAVDGITYKNSMTVDRLPIKTHLAKTADISKVVRNYFKPRPSTTTQLNERPVGVLTTSLRPASGLAA